MLYSQMSKFKRGILLAKVNDCELKPFELFCSSDFAGISILTSSAGSEIKILKAHHSQEIKINRIAGQCQAATSITDTYAHSSSMQRRDF
jgi:hypothetical protein